jgi:hypothetical protein
LKKKSLENRTNDFGFAIIILISSLAKALDYWQCTKLVLDSLQGISAKKRSPNFANIHFSQASIKKLTQSHKGQRPWSTCKGQFDWSDHNIRHMKHSEYVKTNRARRKSIPKNSDFQRILHWPLHSSYGKRICSLYAFMSQSITPYSETRIWPGSTLLL